MPQATKAKITSALLVLALVPLGAAKCEEGDQHPNAPRVPDARKAPDTHHQHAEPVPHADPFLADRAQSDPHLALFTLVSDPGRKWRITMRFDHVDQKPQPVRAGTWNQVLVVASGDHISFSATTEDARKGTVICTIKHINGRKVWGNQTNLGDYQISQGPHCAVSYQIP